MSLLLFACSFLASCNRGNLVYDKPYFDFDSLVTTQVRVVGLPRASLKKTVQMGSAIDTSRAKLDTTDVKHEFEIFQQLDVINKPLFKNAYGIKKQKDEKSNLMVLQYVLRDNKLKAPVPYVRFYFLNDMTQLKRIESSYREQNTLYYTQRNLSMEFDGAGTTHHLSRYAVSGVQKMMLSDSVKFSIEGVIY